MENSFETIAVHAGEDPQLHHGAISTPIYNAALFAFTNADDAAAIHNFEKEGWFYSRLGNPTQDALEKAMCELEKSEAALAFASGMAAITAAILTVVKAGDHIVAPASQYSTTGSFFQYLRDDFGIEVTFTDQTEAENYSQAMRENTKLFYLETPSNPSLMITDLGAVSKIAQENNIVTICDNTFASPYNQNPGSLGIDLSVHSATKYLGGHSDLSAGIIAGRRDLVEIARKKITRLFGGSIAPQTAWLVLRGIKTLALRMERHNQNAAGIAMFLAEHPRVKSVNYPGLSSHKNHEIAKKQMRGFGGMISFDVGSIENGKRFLNGVRICTLATSLGGVETIVQHSASMTHANLTPQQRAEAGVTEGLIRLSVGIENIDDLINDLDSALNQI